MSNASPVSSAHGWKPGDSVVAAGCVLLAVVLFATQDTLSKILVADYSPFEITWVRYVISTILLTPVLVRMKGEALRTRLPWLQYARGCSMIVSSILFLTGVRWVPIADASAINFCSPLLVTALSIPFLGEKVGARRWAAVAIGFVGMLVIVQPGGAAFNASSLVIAASTTFWSFTLILTRRLGRTESSLTTLAYSTLIPAVVLSVVMPFVWRTPDLKGLILMMAIGTISVAGHYLMILGFSKRPASALAPLSYTQLVWAVLYGIFIFDTVPNVSTWVGTAIVVVSGLYVLRLDQTAARPPK